MFDVILFTGVTEMPHSKPLGAYNCANALRSAGYSCLVVDHIQTYTSAELAKLLKVVGTKTFLVGISTTFIAKEQIATILDLCPDTKIVVGGANVNLQESNTTINYAVLGYAENSIVNLANHLAKGTPLENSHKNLWGVVIIDDRMAKGYDFANSSIVWEPYDVVNQTTLPLEVARGCIFKCKFCSYPMNGKKQLDFIKDESVLIRQLEDNYQKYGIYRYTIIDDTFNDNNYKLTKMLEAIKKLSFQPEFWAYTRLDLIAADAERNADLLYNIGLRSTFFGIETLNRDSGSIIGKGGNIKKQIDAVKLIRNKYQDNLRMHGNFIIGLPRESMLSCTDTFYKLMNQELALHSWYFQALRITNPNRFAWNSEITLNYKDYGYSIPDRQEADWVEWKNEYTNFADAEKLAVRFNQLSSASSSTFEHVNRGWADQTLGYTRTDAENKSNGRLELKQKEFIAAYKQQLLDQLTKII
jgi:radical SAM superfamily enzyme YgiQ (UPF0313 family)